MKKIKTLQNNVFMIRKVWEFSPQSLLFNLMEGFIRGVIAAADVIYIKILFDLIGRGESIYKVALVMAVMAATIIVGNLILRWFLDYKGIVIRDDLYLCFQKELFEKAASLDISCYDNPQFYNDFVYAMNEADTRAGKIIHDLSSLLRFSISSLVIIGTLISVDPYIALVVLLINALCLLLVYCGQKYSIESTTQQNVLNRTDAYVGRVFYLPEYAKEIRMSSVKDNIMQLYRENSKKRLDLQKKYGKRFLLTYGTESIITIVYQSAVMIWVTYLLMVAKTIALGGFAVTVNNLWKLYANMKEMFGIIAKFREHGIYVEKYRSFFSYEPKLQDGTLPVPPFETLKLSNVNFGYTDDMQILKNIDLRINRGEKIAIVGYNGAGKSTLIKLLMRLYDANDGTIEWNGTDIRNFIQSEYRSRIGAVFQDYKIFGATIAENVLGDEYDDSKQQTVINALRAATFDNKLNDLKDGIHTPLTREFVAQGVNLSGGESQKIAIARVFAKECDLIIMDEPSSSLDPVSEYQLNQSIAKFAADKTVIFISHRLSTTRMADRIYMFDNGRIIESGTHEDLMSQNGKYAEIFNLQAEKYRQET